MIGKLKYISAKLLKKARGSAINESVLDKTSVVHSGSSIVFSTIGRHSFCGYDCSLVNCDVGSFCSIASNVSIGGVAHPMHFVSTSPVFLSHKDSVKIKYANHEYLPKIRTTVGSDVWIGEGAFIRAGVCIGHGAVIGMGSVVTKDVPPYGIVAGNPAKVIRLRFDADTIRSLLDAEWWKYSDERLHQLGLYFNNPTEFIAKIG